MSCNRKYIIRFKQGGVAKVVEWLLELQLLFCAQKKGRKLKSGMIIHAPSRKHYYTVLSDRSPVCFPSKKSSRLLLSMYFLPTTSRVTSWVTFTFHYTTKKPENVVFNAFRLLSKQGMRELNPRQRFWRPLSYHLTNPLYALFALNIYTIWAIALSSGIYELIV